MAGNLYSRYAHLHNDWPVSEHQRQNVDTLIAKLTYWLGSTGRDWRSGLRFITRSHDSEDEVETFEDCLHYLQDARSERENAAAAVGEKIARLEAEVAKFEEFKQRQDHERFKDLMTGPDPAKVWRQEATKLAYDMDALEAQLAKEKAENEGLREVLFAAHNMIENTAFEAGTPAELASAVNSMIVAALKSQPETGGRV